MSGLLSTPGWKREREDVIRVGVSCKAAEVCQEGVLGGEVRGKRESLCTEEYLIV